MVGLFWLVSMVAFWTLPERFPIHFGSQGPDSWADKASFGGWLSWFAPPLIATVLALGLPWIIQRIFQDPDLIWSNHPNKAEILELPPHQRGQALAPTLHFLDALGVWVLGLFICIQVLTTWATYAKHPGLIWMLLSLLLAIFTTVFLFGGILWLSNKTSQEIERLKTTPA